MRHTNTMDLRGTIHTVSVDTDYDVPKQGYEIHPNIFLTEDMKLGIEFIWDAEEKVYISSPRVTRDGIPCFYADGFSWRITDSKLR